ncbi:hypothetical protein HMPREF1981_00932 [Bacteroides pyogenes F0041]|uniref:Uncharacterized protein n=1 Tax=Bacteroides pyogenes F0041 TaxID=1321819 RepID=U2E291_9BACE|nr:hypothetical protein HMPREF1981_00932 [Bacteroides pyogenes F0041]GAE22530.1 hypothetical protein JCM10003_2147 [Bacteroides pyogenes JCM 10003]
MLPPKALYQHLRIPIILCLYRVLSQLYAAIISKRFFSYTSWREKVLPDSIKLNIFYY